MSGSSRGHLYLDGEPVSPFGDWGSAAYSDVPVPALTKCAEFVCDFSSDKDYIQSLLSTGAQARSFRISHSAWPFRRFGVATVVSGDCLMGDVVEDPPDEQGVIAYTFAFVPKKAYAQRVLVVGKRSFPLTRKKLVIVDGEEYDEEYGEEYP